MYQGSDPKGIHSTPENFEIRCPRLAKNAFANPWLTFSSYTCQTKIVEIQSRNDRNTTYFRNLH
jgi:hypothetical protein